MQSDFFETIFQLCQKQSIKHKHGVSFHKDLVTLNVLFIFLLRSGPDMTN